jgi:hypothetical protein
MAPRHGRGELEPQRRPTDGGAQSRSGRGRAAGREPPRSEQDDARDTTSKRGRGAADRPKDDR